MAWLLRFDDAVSEDTLATEARRLAATPYGLGRRIAPPRLPGGRHRWRQGTRPAPGAVAETGRSPGPMRSPPGSTASWAPRLIRTATPAGR